MVIHSDLNAIRNSVKVEGRRNPRKARSWSLRFKRSWVISGETSNCLARRAIFSWVSFKPTGECSPTGQTFRSGRSVTNSSEPPEHGAAGRQSCNRGLDLLFAIGSQVGDSSNVAAGNILRPNCFGQASDGYRAAGHVHLATLREAKAWSARWCQDKAQRETDWKQAFR
jgi:hypothetical protein